MQLIILSQLQAFGRTTGLTQGTASWAPPGPIIRTFGRGTSFSDLSPKWESFSENRARNAEDPFDSTYAELLKPLSTKSQSQAVDILELLLELLHCRSPGFVYQD